MTISTIAHVHYRIGHIAARLGTPHSYNVYVYVAAASWDEVHKNRAAQHAYDNGYADAVAGKRLAK